MASVEEAERENVSTGKIRQNIEEEMREGQGRSGWQCATVVRNPRDFARIRITYQDESELAQVKVVEKTKAVGSRVLRDQYYPVKVGNECWTAVLNEQGDLRTGAVKMLEKGNEMRITKILLISRRNLSKTYGHIVVYLSKRPDAAKLLEDRHFNVDGELAFTRVFGPRRGPMQCCRCPGLGHEAFLCTEAQVCSRSAQPGHRHSDCQIGEARCAACYGSHELPSRLCRTLYTAHDV